MDWIDVNIQEGVNMCVANVAASALIGKIDDPGDLAGMTHFLGHTSNVLRVTVERLA
jgi:hypothetical protein